MGLAVNLAPTLRPGIAPFCDVRHAATPVTQITSKEALAGLVFPSMPRRVAMKRYCLLAMLMLFSPSAHAGNSISFSVGGHRIHIEASPHCRSTSCASVSISGIYRSRDRYDDDDRYEDDRVTARR